jgi:hypothetical protein
MEASELSVQVVMQIGQEMADQVEVRKFGQQIGLFFVERHKGGLPISARHYAIAESPLL